MCNFNGIKIKSIICFIFYIFIIAILFIMIIIFIDTDHHPAIHEKISVFLTNRNEVEVHFLIFLATIALVFLAYIEFERSNKIKISEVITFISNRWSSKEIIKARQIIHEIFVDKYRFDLNNNHTEDFQIAVRNTSLTIYYMSKKNGKKGKDFIYLLNMLDHFKNTCHLCLHQKIDFKQISEIYGNNIKFYYQVFEKYIDERQKRVSSREFMNFKNLYKKIF